MNRDQDWAIRQAKTFVHEMEKLHPQERKLSMERHALGFILAGMRRAQARERAAWRKAIKRLPIYHNIRDGEQGPFIKIADLLAAMKTKKGQ